MRIARPAVCLLLSLLAMSSVALGAFENFETYLVKSNKVDKLAEGLVIVRRFMPAALKAPERCQRYALVLYSYFKEQKMSQFSLANIGLASNEQTWQSFKTITMDTLRDLYMDAIKQVQEDSDLDPSFLELVDCLKVKFNNYDAKARSFLNNKQLKRVVDQYKSIISQKMDFMLDDSFKHPSITLGELEEPVRRTVLNWFGGDEKRAYSRFLPPLEPPPTTTTSTTPMPIPPPSYSPPFEPFVPPPPPPRSAPLEPNVLAPFPPTPQPPAPAPIVNPYSPEALKPLPDLAKPPVTHLEPHLGAENLADQLPEQQMELLLKVIGLLHDLYNTLPLDSKLNDRCQAYSQLLMADPQTLNSQLVSDISRQVGERIAKNGPSEEKFVPDSNTRENFLFTVSAFPKNEIGDENYMDLVDCIFSNQWEVVDNQVRDFMENPQHYYEVMSQPRQAQM